MSFITASIYLSWICYVVHNWLLADFVALKIFPKKSSIMINLRISRLSHWCCSVFLSSIFKNSKDVFRHHFPQNNLSMPILFWQYVKNISIDCCVTVWHLHACKYTLLEHIFTEILGKFFSKKFVKISVKNKVLTR